jgi:hypothetical protein
MSITLVNNCGWSGTEGYLVLGIYLYRPLEMRPVQRMELPSPKGGDYRHESIHNNSITTYI